MAADFSTGQLADVLLYPETTELGYGPVEDGSTWAAQHTAGNAIRMRVTSIPTEPVIRQVIPSPDLSLRITETHKPILGPRGLIDLPFTTMGYGAEAATADASQVALTGFMQMLSWALGGISRNNTTTVAGVPTSDVEWTLDAATNYAAGQLIFLEDTDDADRAWMRRIESLSGSDVTTHADLPGWNLADNDIVNGGATIYPDVEGLYRGGSAYQTVSALIVRNGSVFQLRGSFLTIDSITWNQDSPPIVNWRLMGGRIDKPGQAPSAPTLTAGDPEGGAGIANGIEMYLHSQDFGTTAHNKMHALSVTLNPGLGVQRMRTVTSENQYVDSMSAYVVGRLAPPTLQVNGYLDTDHDDDFQALTDKVLSFYNVGAAGTLFGCHCPKAVLMNDPPAQIDVSKIYALTYQLREDSVISSTALGRAPYALGVG